MLVLNDYDRDERKRLVIKILWEIVANKVYISPHTRNFQKYHNIR